MKFSNYLKEKIVPFIILLFSIFTIEIFLMLYELGNFIKLYIPICIIVTYFIMAVIEFIKKNHFYNNTLKNLNKLDKKYLIAELIEEPNFTEGKILKEILQESNKSMLENINQYKYMQQEYREYIELWIHEVKTPIATSKMIIENNKNEVTKNIEEEIEKIDNFVEQALFYARSNNIEKDYIIKELNLKEVINKVIIKNRKILLQKKIRIEIINIDEKVYSDAKWLEFIINQIINNSIKYIKKVDSYIQIDCKRNHNMLSIFIKDNGIGIDKKELNKVFDKGFTGENGRKIGKSTGIGLYLCKKLCTKLGHSIQIDSELNIGTVIRIIFPIGDFNNLTKL